MSVQRDAGDWAPDGSWPFLYSVDSAGVVVMNVARLVPEQGSADQPVRQVVAQPPEASVTLVKAKPPLAAAKPRSKRDLPFANARDSAKALNAVAANWAGTLP